MATITGTTGNDVLTGTSGADIITPGAGDDVVDGGGGDDVVVLNELLNQATIGLSNGALVVTGPDGRDSLSNIETLQFNNASFSTTYADAIIADYDAYFHRDPNVGELYNWVSALSAVNGVTLTSMADSIEVTGTYETYLARAPTFAELSYWESQIDASGGQSIVPSLRQAILHSVAGVTFAAATIETLYQDYMPPNVAPQVQNWLASLNVGATFSDVRTALLADPSSQTFVSGELNGLYEKYLSRDASLQEFSAWEQSFSIGATFTDVASALAVSQSQIATTVINSLYNTFLGGPPSAASLAQFTGIYNSEGLSGVYSSFFGDGNVVLAVNSTLIGLYESYLGRSMTSSEETAWYQSFRIGTPISAVSTALAALAPDGAAPVNHFQGTSGVDSFVLSATAGHVVVDGFDPAHDIIILQDLAGFDPTAHETLINNSVETTTYEVFRPPAINFVETDLLITFDSHDSILLRDIGSVPMGDFIHI